MSSLSSFQYSVIDAFSTTPFGGNPAAVVVLDNETMHTFTDDLMQKIAAEFNLSETAFITPTSTPGTFGLRWFTPTAEINLCGHGTLASGFALSLRPEFKDIELFKFNTLSGELTTRKLEDGSLEMNFPALVPEKVSATEYAEYESCVQRAIKGTSKPRIVDISAAEKFLVIQFDKSESENLGDWTVDTDSLKIDKYTLVGFTAKCTQGAQQHIVSRGFGPLLGVPEDPVTGSYHCALAPYWSTRLEAQGVQPGSVISGVQGGRRRGQIRCVWLEKEGRVLLIGHAVEVASGTMRIA
ncbi:hypothetical protein NCC49_000054 [Naganishia albida]|nr:hypothetical protein NCC49_000054 [Naganishia albida]